MVPSVSPPIDLVQAANRVPSGGASGVGKHVRKRPADR